MAICTRTNPEPVRIVYVSDDGACVEVECIADKSRLRCYMTDLRADDDAAEIEAGIVAAGYPPIDGKE